jgi:predicted nuclease of restriction endonuclease-like (RecB) superfamily
MAKKRRNADLLAARSDPYAAILTDVVELLEIARRTSARAVNTVMVSAYWQIGRRIIEFEMRGKQRAEYGEQLIDHLSAGLTARFGRGFSRRAVYQMRAFYQSYPPIVQSQTAQSSEGPTLAIVQSPIAQLGSPAIPKFPLPWSHYVRLLSVENPQARKFYESESLRGGWTVKQLDRQIDTQFFERRALSRNKAAMLTKHNRRRTEDAVTAEEEVKDPFLLEFLGLKDEYSESQLEEALILKLETFLLELGNDFAFIGRQRRLRVGDTWYRIDLLLFHRRLRCLVIVDLKSGRFTHADAGQMHLYCNYAKQHWTHPNENPPVGLILCTDRNDAVAHYSLDGLPNKIMAAQYKITLPNEKLIAQELERSRKTLETVVPTTKRGSSKLPKHRAS